MSDGKVNPRILKAIRENSEGDTAVVEFLTDLLYEEAQHPGQWWWRDTYKKKVKEYAARWENDDAH
jgi:hypothetical protein